MVAMYLHSASNVTQQFYQSALGTAKKKKGAKKGKGKDKETSTGKKENENNEKDENEEGTISSDAGEQAPKKQFEDSVVHVMERAARTIQSGGSVHFLGHGGVGAVGLVSPPDVVSTFGAKPLDVSAHLGTPGGWSALDIPFVSAPPDGTRDISREHFVDEVLPRLGSKDLVVILASGG
jgi:N-acetylmuramic acid 6-phosphate (MurNAc-6-P) etherase